MSPNFNIRDSTTVILQCYFLLMINQKLEVIAEGFHPSWKYTIQPSLGKTAWEVSDDGKILHVSDDFASSLTAHEFKAFAAYAGALCHNQQKNVLTSLSMNVDHTNFLLFLSALNLIIKNELTLTASVFTGAIVGLLKLLHEIDFSSPEEEAIKSVSSLSIVKSAIRKTLAAVGEPYHETLQKLDKLARKFSHLQDAANAPSPA